MIYVRDKNSRRRILEMIFFDVAFWQAFVSNLFSTIIGVILGIPAALYLNGFLERANEKENRKRILLLIWVELNGILVQLEKWKSSPKTYEDIVSLNLSITTETWKTLSDGGELQWIKDPGLLLKLADIYSSLYQVSFLTDKYIILTLKPSYSPYNENVLRSNIEDKEEKAYEKLQEATDKLHKLLNNKIQRWA
jgi:hypothetical protein